MGLKENKNPCLKLLQMSLWGEVLPQMNVSFLNVYAFFMIGKKPKSFQRIGPHNIQELSVIFGSLLGDAFAEFRNGGTRICFQQENSNASYLYMLHSLFAKHGYCNPKKPKLQYRIGKQGKKRFVIRFKTWSFKSFNWIHQAFYQNNVKVIPHFSFLNLFLNEQALAVWIIDNGTVSGNGLSIATNSFPYKDLCTIQNFLKEKYDLQVSIHKCGVPNQFVLYFHVKTIPKLAKLVKPYFIENIMYKLGKHGSSIEDLS